MKTILFSTVFAALVSLPAFSAVPAVTPETTVKLTTNFKMKSAEKNVNVAATKEMILDEWETISTDGDVMLLGKVSAEGRETYKINYMVWDTSKNEDAIIEDSSIIALVGKKAKLENKSDDGKDVVEMESTISKSAVK